MRKTLALLAAAGLAFAPVAANAAEASALSLSHSAFGDFSFLQDAAVEDDDDDDGSTAVILGVVLIVLVGAAAISGDSNQISNSP